MSDSILPPNPTPVQLRVMLEGMIGDLLGPAGGPDEELPDCSSKMYDGRCNETRERKGGKGMNTIKPTPEPQAATGASRRENWWEFLQRARKELEASGAVFRRGVDIAAEIEQIRGEHERPFDVHWEMEWLKHHPEA